MDFRLKFERASDDDEHRDGMIAPRTKLWNVTKPFLCWELAKCEVYLAQDLRLGRRAHLRWAVTVEGKKGPSAGERLRSNEVVGSHGQDSGRSCEHNWPSLTMPPPVKHFLSEVLRAL
jgi:hypothetical protein